MNYAGKFGAEFFLDSSGLHSGDQVHTETVRASHAPQDAIVVPDAQLLFNGEFKRSGADLILSNADRALVLHDYFKGEKHAALSSPDGAHLTGDLVKALVGHVEYAQAGSNASQNNIIGHVTKLVGTAAAIRNGVSIILNNGDNVEKGDVVTSGSDSTLGITFIDGTVFGLSSNARMVLNEMIYDPNGSNNSSLLSLVAGTITFVAGETAKHGDMKVDTPVATMGIRGTAVLVEIDFTVPGGQSAPDAKFQVLVEPDGTAGSYILFDKTTLTPLAVVDTPGLQINISNGILSQTLVPLSPEIQKLIQDLFALKFSDASDTKSFQHFTDVVIQLPLQPSQFPIGSSVAPIIPATLTFGSNSSGNALAGTPPVIIPHIPNALTIDTTSGIIVQRPAATGTAQTTGTIGFNDGNPTDQPTVSVKFDSFTYENAHVPTLSAQQLADIQALEAALTLSPNPGNGHNGADTWTYSFPASALAFLTPGSTLTLTYNATVDNNFAPHDETVTAPFTVTIKIAGEIWSETKEIASPAPHDWNNGANWQTGVAPTAADDVIIATDPQQSGTPVYPVIIKSAEEGGVAAFADSVTMDDLGDVAPELDNFNSLTIGSGGLHLKADSILKNFGTISIGAIAEILQNSVLQNSGLMTLEQGGAFKDSSSITNSGTIEVAAGTLDVEVKVGNSDGTLQVDGGAALVLANGATIMQGALTLGASSVLDVESAGGATLDGVKVTGTGDDSPSLINIGVLTQSGSTLTLQDGASIANGFMTIGFDSVLDVETVGGATLDGVAVTSFGTIEIGTTVESGFGQGPLDGIRFGGATLTLQDGTSIVGGNLTIGVFSTLDVEAGGATLAGVTVDGGVSGRLGREIEIGVNTHTDGGSTLTLLDGTSITRGIMTIAADSTLDVESKGGATLDGVRVVGFGEEPGGTIEIGFHTDGGSTLRVLDGASVTGGKMTIAADSVLDVESPGGAILDGVAVSNGGTIQIESLATLSLSGSTTVSNGIMSIAGLGTLNAGNGTTLDHVTVSGTSGAGGSAINVSGAVTFQGGTAVNGGEMSIAKGATLDIENPVTGTGASLNGVDVVNSGTIQVDSEGPGTTSITLLLDGGTQVTGGTLLVHVGFPNNTIEGVAEIGKGGATLDDVNVINNNQVIIDPLATLTLTDNTRVTGGTIVDEGTLAVASTSEIDNATIDGGGNVVVTDPLMLSNVTLADVTLKGSFTNLDTLTVDDTVTLDGATISGGTIDDTGTLRVAAASEIENATIDGGGDVVATHTLKLSQVTLDDVTLSGSFTNADTLTIDDTVTLDGATLSGGTIDDTGTLSIISASEIENATIDGGGDVVATETLKLSQVTLDNVTLSGSFENADTLTIDETVTLDGATISGSGGTIDDTGTLLVTAASEIDNATIEGGGNVTANKTLTLSAVTLDDVTLSGSFTDADTLTIDGAVTLNGATVSGGAMNIFGVLDSTGTSTLSDVTITNTGTLESTSGKLTISDPAGPTLTNSGTLEANGGELDITSEPVINIGTLQAIDSSLLRLTSTTVTNTGGTVNVGLGSTLDLAGAEIDNGSLTNSGTTNSTGSSTLSDVTITNTGTLESTSGKLTISDPSGPTLTNSGTLEANGGELDIINEPVINTGTLQATNDSTLKLTSTTVTNAGGTVNATVGSTLDLAGTEIDNGSLTNSGTTNSTGSSTLSDVAITNTGTLNVASGTLTVDPAPFINTGTVHVQSGAILVLSGETITNTGGQVNAAGGSTLDLAGTEIDNGSLTNSGTTNSTGSSTLSDVAITNTGTLNVASGTLTVDPAPFINTGTVDVESGAILALSGETVTNTGGTVNAGGGSTLDLAGAEIDNGTLTNSGMLNSTGTSTLSDVTITNTGTLESTSGKLTISDPSGPTLTNSGTLEANGGELDITNEPVINTGTLQAIDDSTLKLTSTTVTNTGGTVNVGGGSALDLSNAAIDTGTLTNSGMLNSTGTSALSDVAITNTGTLESTGGKLTISDPAGPTLTNTGTLEANGGELDITNEPVINTGTLQAIDDSTLKLTSTLVTNTGGTVNVGGGSTLDLAGTEIDNGSLTNSGTTNSTGSSTLSDVAITNTGTLESTSGKLTISDPSGPTLTNTGTLEANGGELDITNEPVINTGTLQAINNSTLKLTSTTVTNTGGTVNVGGGSTLDLAGAEIDNGSLTNSGTTNSTGTSTLSDVAITNMGTLESTGGTLTISDPSGPSVTNFGFLEANGGELDITNEPVINNGALQAINGSTLKLTTTKVTNTAGLMNVGVGSTLDLISAEIDNGSLGDSGTFDSTGISTLNNVAVAIFGTLESTSGALTILGAAAPSVTNFGTLEANGGELEIINGAVTNTGSLRATSDSTLKLASTVVTNTNGAVNVDVGSTLDLVSAEIDNGNFTNFGTTNSTGTSTLSGVAVTNTGSINIVSGKLTIDPAPFTNTGIVDVESGAILVLSGETVTNIGGTLETTGSGLLDLVNATINNGTLGGRITTAAGNIGSTLNGLTLAFGGLVTAAVGALELTGSITNNGEFDANTGATLGLDNVTITGGKLGGAGTIATAASTFDALNGVTIAHGTTVTVTDGTTLDLVGTITDTGTIVLASSGHATQLEISGAVPLVGGGNVTMTDNTHNSIVSDGLTATLTNNVTISGAGTIGDSHLTLINNGTIDATGANPLVIDTGVNSTTPAGLVVGNIQVTNNTGATLEASAGTTLKIEDNVLNDGTIAAGSSAHVTIAGNVATDTGDTGNINISGHAIVEIGGTVDKGQTVTFEVPNGQAELILDDPSGFKGVIAGLVEAPTESTENYIDLKGFTDTSQHPVKVVSAVFNSATDVTAVTITNGTNQPNLTIYLHDDYSAREIEFASDGAGGTFFSDPAASSGTVTIDSGQTLDIGGASSATITFANSTTNTGMLELADSKDFTGTIAGFAGDGTTANSDLIDVADLNFADVALNKTTYTDNGNGTGTLTLFNANGQSLDSLTFAGNYQLANFTIENDGSGNTLIVDPPVSQPASTVVASGPNQVLTGPASGDTFVFNFAAVGHATITNFDPAADALQFAGSVFANAQAALNATHDDGHGNAVIAIDAHDSITLNGVAKAQLHAADFHFV